MLIQCWTLCESANGYTFHSTVCEFHISAAMSRRTLTGFILDFRFGLTAHRNTHTSKNCLYIRRFLDDISPNNFYYIVRALTPFKGGSSWARWFQKLISGLCSGDNFVSLLTCLLALHFVPHLIPGWLFWETVLSHHLFSWLSFSMDSMGREGWFFQRSLFPWYFELILPGSMLDARAFCLGPFELESFQHTSHQPPSL